MVLFTLSLIPCVKRHGHIYYEYDSSLLLLFIIIIIKLISFSFASPLTTVRQRGQLPAGGQLDDLHEGAPQLFAARRLPVLLQRAAGDALRRGQPRLLRRLHDRAVSGR